MVDYSKNNYLLAGLQIGNGLAFVATVFVNALANILPLGGKTTAELSDSLPNLFVPAGYVFAIWGVIYLLLAMFVLYQFFPILDRNRDSRFLQQINLLFILGSIANIAWIFFWHFQVVILSIVAMLVLLGCLIAIYTRLGIGAADVTGTEKFLVHLPFSVYLGWITVATVANVTAVLVSFPIDWSLHGVDVFLTVIVLFVVLTIVTVVLLSRKDVAYSLVIVWALVGIAFKQMTESLGVAVFAGVIAGAIAVGAILVSFPYIEMIFRNLRSKFTSKRQMA